MFEVSQKNDLVRIDHKDIGVGWEQRYLLTSDWHIDNPDSRKDILFKHMDYAKKINAGIFCFGDLFCAMQGRNDRRGAKGKVRNEHYGPDYFDLLPEEVAKELVPYHDNILLMSMGNHETAILRHNETNLLKRLVNQMNSRTEEEGHKIIMGQYGGYVAFRFYIGTSMYKVLLKYFHGAGGGAPVTKGAIQHQRAALMYAAPDIVVMGHTHTAQMTVHSKEWLTDNGKVQHRHQFHVRTPSYKDEYKKSEGGWAVEKGGGPMPIGSWWLNFRCNEYKTITVSLETNIPMIITPVNKE